jgi:predicted dehydrogenase
MQLVNWGIIGCGSVTEIKSGPAFNKVEGSELVAVMRRDVDKAKDYARRHHVPAWYDNAGELINDPRINAVYISTPPSSHAGYAIQAMEAGKAVYVEKPMAAGYADCVAMNEVSLRTGMPLYVAYYRRFLPYFIKVKEILDSGVLGQLHFARIDFHIPPRREDYNSAQLPWRVIPEIAGGGYFYDLACHQLDLFSWFFGKATDIYGKTRNKMGLYKAEDLVMAEIDYESGLSVSATWCFVSDSSQNEDRIRVFGSKATLEFSTFAFTPIRITGQDGVVDFLPPNPENIQFWFIKNMVEELQGFRVKSCNGEIAAHTNWIMDKILAKI